MCQALEALTRCATRLSALAEAQAARPWPMRVPTPVYVTCHGIVHRPVQCPQSCPPSCRQHARCGTKPLPPRNARAEASVAFSKRGVRRDDAGVTPADPGESPAPTRSPATADHLHVVSGVSTCCVQGNQESAITPAGDAAGTRLDAGHWRPAVYWVFLGRRARARGGRLSAMRHVSVATVARVIRCAVLPAACFTQGRTFVFCRPCQRGRCTRRAQRRRHTFASPRSRKVELLVYAKRAQSERRLPRQCSRRMALNHP